MPFFLLAAALFLIWQFSKRKKTRSKPPKPPLDVRFKKLRAEVRRQQFAADYKREHQGKTSAASYRAFNKLHNLSLTSYIVLDTETTGLSPESDELIEVAALRVEGDEIVDQYTTLINPGRMIPREVAKLTGISTKDILLAPVLERVAPKLGEFIEGYPVVAHNAVFHVKFVTAALRREGVYGNIQYVDTLEIAREAFPGRADYSLDTLARELELPPSGQEHRAISHAQHVHALYCRCKEELLIRVQSQKQAKKG